MRDIEKTVICFGEVLWDLLPSGSIPGGAPMNVAIRSKSLGLSSKIISRIGNDTLGENILNYLIKQKVDVSLLQIDSKLPTGTVHVALDSNGIANYTIHYPSAWDNIELSENVEEWIRKSDAFIFGSLACRTNQSRNTLFKLIEQANFKVFDVNLRPGFFDLHVMEHLLKRSDLVKLNDEELLILAERFGSKAIDIKEMIVFLHQKFQLKSVCVTLGEKGAILFEQNRFYLNEGIKVEVADTVGAGDSFLAALVVKRLSKENPQEALNFACAVGALVASKVGANPELSNQEIKTVMDQVN